MIFFYQFFGEYGLQVLTQACRSAQENQRRQIFLICRKVLGYESDKFTPVK